MSFNTYSFVLLFLPIAVIGYHMINSRDRFSLAKWFLVVMSAVFIIPAGLQGFTAIILLILINYAIYRFGYATDKVKAFMVLGIAVNVLSLIFYKYSDKITGSGGLESAATDAGLFGTGFKIIVPLGISFITFSQISFIIEEAKKAGARKTDSGETGSDIVSNGSDNSIISLQDYMLYVLFFPKVTMGPIALSSDFIPQINTSLKKKADYDNIAKGLMCFAFGLAKKMLLADTFAGYVGYAYDHSPILGMTNAWIAVIAYTLQIYFDFSGFCDMAVGIGYMFNMDIPINFNSPYRSLSIGEFWDRWHITLTQFFTKYIYIPLGGSRKGTLRTYINILIVFLVSGIWHGSTINFVIWGLIHGVLSCISKAIKPVEDKIPKAIRWFVTFICINIAWVFFRAPSLADAGLMLKELFSFEFLPVDSNFAVYAMPEELNLIPWILSKFAGFTDTYMFGAAVNVLFIIFGLFASTKMKNTGERARDFKADKKTLAVTVILLVWSIMSLSEVATFIYVNF